MKNSTEEWIYILALLFIAGSLFLDASIRYIVPVVCLVFVCIRKFAVATKNSERDR